MDHHGFDNQLVFFLYICRPWKSFGFPFGDRLNELVRLMALLLCGSWIGI